MSGVAFDQLTYEEGRHLELLQGELIDVPNATLKHQLIVLDLGGSLRQYFWREPCGGVAPDVDFALAEDTRLRPDLAILLGEHWASVDENKTPISLTPDIVVEVVSPSERVADSLRKIRTYLRAGVREVWQVAPGTQQVFIHRAGPSVAVLEIDDILKTPLLPGWEISLREIFRAK